MGIGKNILQGARLLFGKSEANETPSNLDVIQFNSATNQWELVSGVIGNAVQTSSNVGTGEGVAKARIGDDLPFRSFTTTSKISLTGSADEIEIDIGILLIADITGLQTALDSKLESPILISDVTGLQTALDSKIETITNVGGFNEIAKAKVGQNVDVRTLQAGTNITITQNADDIEIESTASGGQDNTASNVGVGVGVFKQKTGVDLEFKSILAGNGIDVNSLTDEVEIVNVKPSYLLNTMNTEIISAGTSTFFAIVGFASDDVDEIDRQVIFPSACILHRMALEISVNASASGASVLVLRINGVDGNMIITVPALTTGSFQDLSNSDAISNLDLVAFRFNKGADFSITLVATGLEVIEP